MSVQPVVAAVDPEVKPANVVENVDDHTPAPATPPVVEHVPDPPTPQDGGLDELKTVVAGMGAAIATLTDLVTSQIKDATPVKPPWTHYGSHDNPETD